jgi:uncharacterized protein (UPF0264 family)
MVYLVYQRKEIKQMLLWIVILILAGAYALPPVISTLAIVGIVLSGIRMIVTPLSDVKAKREQKEMIELVRAIDERTKNVRYP